MKITKFVLHAGRIESTSDLDSEMLNVGLLRDAVVTLERLRQRDSEKTQPIPGTLLSRIQGRSFQAGLGFPPAFSSLTPANLRLSPEQHKQMERSARGEEFYIQLGDQFALFRIVHSTTRENDPGVYGTVAGSHAGAFASLPEDQRGSKPSAEKLAQIRATANQIESARPALIAPPTGKGFCDPFVDCFAAAMLLYPEM